MFSKPVSVFYDAPTASVLCSARPRAVRPARLGRVTRQYRAVVLFRLLPLTWASLALSAPATASADGPEPAPNAEPPAATEPFILVEGQVTNALGGGHRHVVVKVFRPTEVGGPGRQVASATTDEWGDFRVETDRPIEGKLLVTLSMPNYAELARTVERRRDEPPPFVAATLRGDLSLTGTVADAANDRAVADAKITLKSDDLDRTARTDEEGKFEFDSVAPGAGQVVVEAAGYGREQHDIERFEDQKTVTITLRPEHTAEVTVVGEDGGPIGGAVVEIYDAPRGDFRSLLTDAAGRATIDKIHADARSLQLRVSHEDYVTEEGFAHVIDLPERHSSSTHTITLTRAGTIEGRIIEADTRKPVYAARIITGTEYSDSSPRAWSDADGNYRIRGVAPGVTIVTVHRTGFAPELRTIQLESGATVKVNFSLSPAAEFTGRVINESGEPVSDAYVATTRWRGYGTLGLRAETDRQGRFVIRDAPRDEIELEISAAGYEPAKKALRTGTEPVEITLSGASDEQTRTVGPQPGDPVPSVTVTNLLDGSTIDFAALNGKFVLVNFWATWCPPCIDEMKHLIEVHEKWGSRDDFLIVGISRDFDEAQLRNFLKRNPKVAWPQVFGKTGGVPEACEAFGVSFIPRLFLLGPDGKVLANHFPRADNIVERVEKLLENVDGP